jgi:dynactin complex subunit
MMGTVRYIGDINSGEGPHLGIEFANKVGKNDGSIDGERYFSTDPDRGLFVKADQATWRGIKCSLVLDQVL